MHSKTVFPVPSLGGELRVPGDKSVSQRIAMLAALAKGTSEVRGFLRSEDAMSTLGAMCSLGASTRFDGDVLRITGTGGKFKEPANPLDMGNSGTGTRLLAGLLAGQKMAVTMTGDASLSRRPMGRIKTPLEQMGARIELTGEKGTLPMTIRGSPLHGIRYELPVASAQVKSCVLLAGLFADGKTTVVEPRPTRDHTEKLFQALDIPVNIDGLEISLQGFGPKGPQVAARRLTVPGDFSSAAFWIAAVAARPGAELIVRGVGLNPRRTAMLDVLKRMGALIETEITDGEGDPIGTVFVRGADLRGTRIGGDEIPNLIDELPMLAVTGALANGDTMFRDAAELRVKESDRIAVTAEHLRSFGVRVKEHPDGMTIYGPARLHAPSEPLDSHGDHRITMSMAMLATFSDGPVQLKNVNCVATSYPEFWDHLTALGGKVE
ncbi:MAG: 3-phosphoshikimate 1-carboxyvinyltransferase [Kiritimatiellales bacterium]